MAPASGSSRTAFTFTSFTRRRWNRPLTGSIRTAFRTGICFMKEKEQVGADVYIDDSPGNVEQLRGKGLYTICFANSTNKNTPEPRAKSWEHVYELVHQWAAKRKSI